MAHVCSFCGARSLKVCGRRYKAWWNIFGNRGDAGGVQHSVDDLHNHHCPGLCLGVGLGRPKCEMTIAKGAARWADQAGACCCCQSHAFPWVGQRVIGDVKLQGLNKLTALAIPGPFIHLKSAGAGPDGWQPGAPTGTQLRKIASRWHASC